MFISLCFLVYFFSLMLFSLMTHPVYYCGLLVFNSLMGSMICYFMFGFSWYSLLFCLVYMGGVYILFMFVSVFKPNKSMMSNFKFSYSSMFVLFFILLCVGGFMSLITIYEEFSSYLCTLSEGNFYICMCLTLVFGFVLLSFVMSVKFNHYR